MLPPQLQQYIYSKHAKRSNGSPDIDSKLYESADILKIHGVNEFIADISRKAKDEVEDDGSDVNQPTPQSRCGVCAYATFHVQHAPSHFSWWIESKGVMRGDGQLRRRR